MTSRLTALAKGLGDAAQLRTTQPFGPQDMVIAAVFRAYAAALVALVALPGWASEDEAARLHHWRLSQDALAAAETVADAVLGKEETG